MKTLLTHNLTPHTVSALNEIPQIKHAFFTRHGGISPGIYASLNCGFSSADKLENIRENRRRAMGFFGKKGNALVTINQVHGSGVINVKEIRNGEQQPKADGMVTKKKGIVLGILTADCAPVLFAEPSSGIIGACHAGWRGALSGIVPKTVNAMENMGAMRKRIIAAIGPCIGQRSYEVGSDFKEKFLEKDKDYEKFFQSVGSTLAHFNLPGFVEWQLQVSGVTKHDRIKTDNFMDENILYSYRRMIKNDQSDYGRGLSAIMIKDET